MQYRVVSKTVSGNIDNGVPFDVTWYTGGNLASAMAALAQAAANYNEDFDGPESVRTHTLDVRLEFEADCPWRDQPVATRPFWAQEECSGREVETEVGILCATHHKSMRRVENMVVDPACIEAGARASTCTNDGNCPMHNFSEILCDHEWEAASHE